MLESEYQIELVRLAKRIGVAHDLGQEEMKNRLLASVARFEPLTELSCNTVLERKLVRVIELIFLSLNQCE